MLGSSRVVAALLASVLVVSPALAQPTSAPTPAQKQQASDLVKQAITKSQAKDHLAAIDLYLKAYGVVPLPSLLSNVGTEYQQAKKPVEALKYFCMYLEKDPTGTLSTYVTAQAKVLELELGDKDESTVCKPMTTSTVGTTTTTNGGPGTTDPTDTGKPDPDLDQKLVQEPPPGDPGKTLKLAGLITAGAGVVGLGIGFYFGKEAGRISDEISNQPMGVPWPDAIKDIEAEGQRDENLQITFLVTGGLLVIGGTAMYFVGRAKTSSAEKPVVPVPTATSTSSGVAPVGRF